MKKKKKKKSTKFSNQGWMLMTIYCNVNKFNVIFFRVVQIFVFCFVFIFFCLLNNTMIFIKLNGYLCTYLKKKIISFWVTSIVTFRRSIETYAFKKHLQKYFTYPIIFVKQQFQFKNSCYLIYKYAVSDVRALNGSYLHNIKCFSCTIIARYINVYRVECISNDILH